MPRTRSHTRRPAKSNPCGLLNVQKGGYAFVQTAEGEYFVPASKLNGAFDGDTVEIARLPKERGKRQGAPADAEQKAGQARAARVVRVITRAHDCVIGRYEVAEPFGVVVPDDERIPYDIFTERRQNPTIPDGAIVRVRITEYPRKNTACCGVIEEVMADSDDERIPIDLIVARYRLETEFSQASLDQVAQAGVDVEGALGQGYTDIRNRFVFTVDPASARDFDDAVSWEKVAREGEGAEELYRIGVHIADVSYYVPWGSSVDLDARRRATSVYLVDRVIPMLPEGLSNELCSLKPGVDRRAMTVDLTVNGAGDIRAVRVYPSLITSRARLSYEQAQSLLEQHEAFGVDASLCDALACRLEGLMHFAHVRRERRAARGGLDFETVEAKVQLDEQGVPVGINLRRKTDATSLIEEAMIAANEAVATRLCNAGMPCLYRVHEQPAHENLKSLVAVFEEFDWFARINRYAFSAGNPAAVEAALQFASGRPEELLVSTLILRAMKRACYSSVLDAHYGLASDCYCHFTSPIRRYPDLVVHRMLKAQAFGKPEKFDQEVSALPWIAEHCSDMERTAERAASDSQEVKIVEYMENFVGQTFSAFVAGVASYGLFVRLENTAQGLVSTDDMGDEYFSLDPVKHTLTGSDSGKSYRLGQHVAVVLTRADHRCRQLDFKLVHS